LTDTAALTRACRMRFFRESRSATSARDVLSNCATGCCTIPLSPSSKGFELCFVLDIEPQPFQVPAHLVRRLPQCLLKPQCRAVVGLFLLLHSSSAFQFLPTEINAPQASYPGASKSISKTISAVNLTVSPFLFATQATSSCTVFPHRLLFNHVLYRILPLGVNRLMLVVTICDHLSISRHSLSSSRCPNCAFAVSMAVLSLRAKTCFGGSSVRYSAT